MPARDSERTSLRASDNSDTSRTNRRSSCNRRACNSADGASKAKPALPSRAWEAASHASTPAAPLCHHGPGCFGRAAGWSGVRWHTPPLCGARPRGVTSRTRCSEPRPLRHRAHLTRLLLPIKLPAVCMHRASRRSEDDWSGGRSVLEVGRSIDRSPERLNWILAAAASTSKKQSLGDKNSPDGHGPFGVVAGWPVGPPICTHCERTDKKSSMSWKITMGSPTASKAVSPPFGSGCSPTRAHEQASGPPAMLSQRRGAVSQRRDVCRSGPR